MKSIGIKNAVVAIIMTCAFALCVQAEEAQAVEGQSKIRIGVLNLDVIGIDAAQAAQAQDSVVQYLSDLGFYKVYAQADIERAFASIKQRIPAHCRDPRCVAAIGSALGLDRMLYGCLDKNGGRYGITLSILDVQTMAVSKHVTLETESGAPVSDLVRVAVTKLHGLDNGKDSIKTHAYYGPEIYNGKQALYSAAGFLAVSLAWAGANGSLKNFQFDHRFDNETLYGQSASALNNALFGRPAALGNCYVAASDDAYGVLYNPAGMAWLQHSDIAIGYQYRYDLINNFVASYAAKATRELGYGYAAYYNGDYEGKQNELYFLSSWGYKFNGFLSFPYPFSIGATVKFINIRTPQSDDGTVSGNTVGAGLDLGFMTEFTDYIRFGFVFKDVPTVTKVDNDRYVYKESYPTTLLVGGTYRAGYTTFLICEGTVPLNEDQTWKFGGGIEQEFFDIFVGRVGLRKEASFNTPWIVTAGFGTQFKTESIAGHDFSLDGSYEYNTLGMFAVANVSLRIGY